MSADTQTPNGGDTNERLARIEEKLDDHRKVESKNGEAIQALSGQVKGMSEQMVTKKEFGKLDETLRGIQSDISDLRRR